MEQNAEAGMVNFGQYQAVDEAQKAIMRHLAADERLSTEQVYDYARLAVMALREMPSDQRMLAMGMEPVAWDNPPHYPVQHVRLVMAPMPRRERILYGEVDPVVSPQYGGDVA